jgi:nitrite reductase/ring-hydroxylating ferredoxin subunit
MHGWTFSLRTGHAVRGSGRIRVYPVHEEEGWVAIGLEEAI